MKDETLAPPSHHWESIVSTARRLDSTVLDKRNFEPQLALQLARAVLAFNKHMDRAQTQFPDPVPHPPASHQRGNLDSGGSS